jgi:uncharacterized membrane protein YgdD (TMEM256/DUF423 family)
LVYAKIRGHVLVVASITPGRKVSVARSFAWCYRVGWWCGGRWRIIVAMTRIFVALSGSFGLLGVALGAFGAHGLRSRLEVLPDGAKRLEWWSTAAHYNLTHALAIGLAAWLVHRGGGMPATIAGWFFATGISLFSGSLYTMALTGQTRLGAITPVGGLLLMGGWVAVVVAGLRLTGGHG